MNRLSAYNNMKGKSSAKCPITNPKHHYEESQNNTKEA